MTLQPDRKTDVFPHVEILGVEISATNLPQAVETIHGWIRRGERQYVCITPAHGVMECQRDPKLLPVFNGSGMTTPDGMAIVWLLKLYGQRGVSRVYGPDLMRAVCARSAQDGGYRHFLYGGAPGVAEKLSQCLQANYPGICITGIYCPPFRELTPEEDQLVIEQINISGADIVWVGISTPRQERWMAEHLGKLNAPVLIGVGAAFDFISGMKKEAPRWVQKWGLQWLHRLFSEPHRLGPRYAEYPRFAWLAAVELIRQWYQRASGHSRKSGYN